MRRIPFVITTLFIFIAVYAYNQGDINFVQFFILILLVTGLSALFGFRDKKEEVK